MIGALLICPVLWKPAICDSNANICYAISISNRFSSMPIKQASMAESDVEEISTRPVVTHSIDPCLNGLITVPPSFQPLAPVLIESVV